MKTLHQLMFVTRCTARKVISCTYRKKSIPWPNYNWCLFKRLLWRVVTSSFVSYTLCTRNIISHLWRIRYVQDFCPRFLYTIFVIELSKELTRHVHNKLFSTREFNTDMPIYRKQNQCRKKSDAASGIRTHDTSISSLMEAALISYHGNIAGCFHCS